ncbi:basic proline-rich protein-like [Nyctibius grandis]|uniref:basic proline-rich protein-like n=1 Tax=Nyctibius grandis TaxID=48427 RepID=UPI0035BBBDF8
MSRCRPAPTPRPLARPQGGAGRAAAPPPPPPLGPQVHAPPLRLSRFGPSYSGARRPGLPARPRAGSVRSAEPAGLGLRTPQSRPGSGQSPAASTDGAARSCRRSAPPGPVPAQLRCCEAGAARPGGACAKPGRAGPPPRSLAPPSPPLSGGLYLRAAAHPHPPLLPPFPPGRAPPFPPPPPKGPPRARLRPAHASPAAHPGPPPAAGPRGRRMPGQAPPHSLAAAGTA